MLKPKSPKPIRVDSAKPVFTTNQMEVMEIKIAKSVEIKPDFITIFGLNPGWNQESAATNKNEIGARSVKYNNMLLDIIFGYQIKLIRCLLKKIFLSLCLIPLQL